MRLVKLVELEGREVHFEWGVKGVGGVRVKIVGRFMGRNGVRVRTVFGNEARGSIMDRNGVRFRIMGRN